MEKLVAKFSKEKNRLRKEMVADYDHIELKMVLIETLSSNQLKPTCSLV
jgi:hypothetical protein